MELGRSCREPDIIVHSCKRKWKATLPENHGALSFVDSLYDMVRAFPVSRPGQVAVCSNLIDKDDRVDGADCRTNINK